MGIEEVEIFLSWKDDKGSERWMYFDCVEAVNHTMAVELSEAPREDGTPLADHAFNLPDAVSLAGTVSNTPLPSNPAVGEAHEQLGRSALMKPTDIKFNLPRPPRPPSVGILIADGVNAATSAVTNAVGLTDAPPDGAAGVWAAEEYLDRVKEAFEILRDVKRKFYVLKIRTPLWQYSNMVIRSLNIPETPSDGSSRTFSIDITEALTASASLVEAPQPAEIRARPPQNSAKQNKNDPKGDEKKGANESLAVKLVDGGYDGAKALLGF